VVKCAVCLALLFNRGVAVDSSTFEKTKKMLIYDEGIRLKPYRCTAGKLTIGVGHNLDDKGISHTSVFQILADDVADVEEALVRIFGSEFIETISEERRLGLINLVFNMGEAGFLKFAPTIALMKAGRWEEASQRLLKSKYASQVKSRAARVALLLNGTFPYA